MNNNILRVLVENGILDLSDIRQFEDMDDKYLSMHKAAVYQGKDGYWYTYLPEENKRRKVKKRNKEDLENVISSYYKELEENPVVEEIFLDWQDRRIKTNKIKQSTYLRNEQIFNRHFAEFGKRRVKELTESDICDFLEAQIPAFNLSAKSFSNLKSITRGILKRAKKLGYISFSVDSVLNDLDVSDRQFKRSAAKDEDEVFFDSEVEAVLNYCYRNKSDICCIGVALMFITGMRVGEVVALEGKDISGDVISVSKTETRFKVDVKYVYEVSPRPKTDAGIRLVIVPRKYLWVLEEIAGKEGYIFTNKKGERLHTHTLRKQMYQICSKLGINRRSPHKARKTYGSILLDSRVNSKIIESQMGHSSVSITETHYHKDRKSLDEKREIINSIPEFEN